MNTLIIRFRLKLPGFILFNGFTPSEEDGALDFDLGVGAFAARLFDDIPASERELEIQVERQCRPGFAVIAHAEGKEAVFSPILELRDPSPPREVVEALQEGSTTSYTNEYASRILSTVLRIQDCLVHLLRVSYNQFWLKHEFRSETPEDNLQGWLDMWKSTWLHPEDGWKRLVLGNRQLSLTVYPWDGIEKCKWLELGNKVSELVALGQIPMWQVLCANSVEHVSKGNSRLAILEVVTALEIMVKKGLCAALIPTVADEERTRVIDKVVEKVGLRAGTKLLLAMSTDETEAESILRAIDLRNEVVHSSRRSIPYDEARHCVNAVRHFMVRLAGKN